MAPREVLMDVTAVDDIDEKMALSLPRCERWKKRMTCPLDLRSQF
jgi:hypothetical protein